MTRRVALVTRSSGETEELGESLAPLLEVGDVVLLQGPLGAGKTRFAVGLARGLGVRGRVRSPSFTLVSEHHGRLLLAHADLYRLSDPVDSAALGLEEYRERGVLAVEWGDRLSDSWSADALCVSLAFADGDRRAVELSARGARSTALLETWEELGRKP